MSSLCLWNFSCRKKKFIFSLSLFKKFYSKVETFSLLFALLFGQKLFNYCQHFSMSRVQLFFLVVIFFEFHQLNERVTRVFCCENILPMWPTFLGSHSLRHWIMWYNSYCVYFCDAKFLIKHLVVVKGTTIYMYIWITSTFDGINLLSNFMLDLEMMYVTILKYIFR